MTQRSLTDSQVCIIGLGLMGGSLALALRDHVAVIRAIDTDPATCDLALASGIADYVGSDLGMAAEADLVILATPMRTLIGQIDALGSILKPGAVLIDLGSVKAPVIDAMNRLPEGVQAIGGHPMCGREVGGLLHAEASLFQGARFVLCPCDRTTPDVLTLAHTLVGSIGAVAIEMDAARHDGIAAIISGLAYLLSSALVGTADNAAQTDAAVWELAASGFRDTSRLAGSDPAIMTDLLLTNSASVLEAISEAQGQLDALADLIRAGDADTLREVLKQIQAARATWQEHHDS